MASKILVGWREWVSLPELGIRAIKAKVDTGARTSALHAFEVDRFEADGRSRVRFGIHPLQMTEKVELFCVADVIDQRVVIDSGGHREERCVIRTPIRVGDREWPIEITLTNREDMLFRMLLGRTAMRRRVLVNPSASFLTGTELSEAYLDHL
jgi:hypothetical protein